MFLHFPEVRPAIIPSELQALLKELLAFRHLYRHGYDLQLDGAKLDGLIDHWKRDRHELFRAFQSFREELLRRVSTLPA
jgi:hypothetical protein